MRGKDNAGMKPLPSFILHPSSPPLQWSRESIGFFLGFFVLPLAAASFPARFPPPHYDSKPKPSQKMSTRCLEIGGNDSAV
jgi:hypothetical protein